MPRRPNVYEQDYHREPFSVGVFLVFVKYISGEKQIIRDQIGEETHGAFPCLSDVYLLYHVPAKSVDTYLRSIHIRIHVLNAIQVNSFH